MIAQTRKASTVRGRKIAATLARMANQQATKLDAMAALQSMGLDAAQAAAFSTNGPPDLFEGIAA